jgi:hypothetical protein
MCMFTHIHYGLGMGFHFVVTATHVLLPSVLAVWLR